MLYFYQDARPVATKELSDLNFEFFEFKEPVVVFYIYCYSLAHWPHDNFNDLPKRIFPSEIWDN